MKCHQQQNSLFLFINLNSNDCTKYFVQNIYLNNNFAFGQTAIVKGEVLPKLYYSGTSGMSNNVCSNVACSAVLQEEQSLNKVDSKHFVKRMLALGISNIIYLRNIFPECAFADRRIEGEYRPTDQ